MSVGQGIAETVVGLDEMAVKVVTFHLLFFIIGIPKISHFVLLPQINGILRGVGEETVAYKVLAIVLVSVVVTMVNPSG